MLKPTALIFADTKCTTESGSERSCRLSTVQHRAFNAILSVIQQTKTDTLVYTVDFNKFRKLCNDRTNNPTEFFNNIKLLTVISFVLNKNEHITKSSNLILSIDLLCDAVGRPHTIRFKITRLFKHLLDNLTQNSYANIDQNVVNNLQSVYAISLYETLTDYAGAEKYPKMTIKEFRHLIKVDPESYKDIRRFREHVLIPMRNKVNAQLTTLSYDFKLYKEQGEYYIEWIKLSKIKESSYSDSSASKKNDMSYLDELDEPEPSLI